MPENRNRENKYMRGERIPVDGMRDIMTVLGKDPEFQYRWVTDEEEHGSRIMKFFRGGWTFARADEDITVGQEFVYKSKQDGSIVRQMTGDGKYSYLMKIRSDWYEEDQKAKQDNIDEMEDLITGTGHPDGEDFGQYGSVKIDHQKK